MNQLPTHDDGPSNRMTRRHFFQLIGLGGAGAFCNWGLPTWLKLYLVDPIVGWVSYRFKYVVITPPERQLRFRRISKTDVVS